MTTWQSFSTVSCNQPSANKTSVFTSTNTPTNHRPALRFAPRNAPEDMTRDFSETFRAAREFNKDLAARRLDDLQMDEYVFLSQQNVFGWYSPSLPNTFWIGVWFPKHLLKRPLEGPNITLQGIWIILGTLGMLWVNVQSYNLIYDDASRLTVTGCLWISGVVPPSLCSVLKVKGIFLQNHRDIMAGQPTPPNVHPPRNKALWRAY